MTNWLAFMTRTDGSRAVYLWRAYLAVMLGTVLFALVAVLAFPAAEEAGAEVAARPPFFGFVILWPLISTLLLWGVLEGLRRFTPTYWHAAGGAALLFAGVFAFGAGVEAGLILIWPHLIYALTFLAWHLKSNLEGVVMTFTLQVAVNMTASLLLF